MDRDEQLYYGGDIRTMDDRHPGADAVAVRDGIIIGLGSLDACRSLLSPSHQPIDLRGSAMLPGFIDSHLHPTLMIYFDLNVDLGGVRSMAHLKQRLLDAGAEKPDDMWIVGLNFDEQLFNVPVLPSRHDLDEVYPGRPAVVVRHDGHMVIANTKVLELLGLSSSTPDPEGGSIDREPDGHPAGPFRENATPLILNAIPIPPMESIIKSARGTFERIAGHGITSAGMVLQTDKEGPAGSLGAFDLMLMQALMEHIPISMYGIITARDAGVMREVMASPLNDPAEGSRFRIGAMKLYADGTFGSCSAYMREPYTDRPDTRGYLTTPEKELYSRMVDAHKAGIQIATHAIGDAGNRLCIDLLERLLQEHPRPDHRHRIEHASQLDAGMISDMARLGIAVSSQPMFIHSEKNWLRRRIGAERTPWTYPYRSLMDAGVAVAGASDAPIESVSVLHALQCCVTREGFETGQCVTAHEALRMYTVNAAYAQFEEGVKGSISAGKRADFVILDRDPVRVPAEEIMKISVRKTICGGKVIFSR